MPLSLLLALVATPAQAESEILFRTSRPVLIYVDGRQAPITSNLRMRASDLEAGAHEITVKGMFGKTLYEGEIQLEDWTVAHADWNQGELQIRKTETIARPGARGRRGSPWADEAGEEPILAEGVVILDSPPPTPAVVPPAEPAQTEEVAEAPAVVTPPEAPAAAPVEQVVAAPAAAAPAPVAEAVVAAPPVAALAIPAAAPEVAPEPADEPMGAVLTPKSGGIQPMLPPAMRIQAREGMRLELDTGEAILFVTVVDGAFVLDFPESAE